MHCGTDQGRVSSPEWVCTVVWRRESPEWDACHGWVREGRRARPCEDGGYARVEVNLDVCRLHKRLSFTQGGVQSTSSAQCSTFDTGLVLLSNHHVIGPMESFLFRASPVSTKVANALAELGFDPKHPDVLGAGEFGLGP